MNIHSALGGLDYILAKKRTLYGKASKVGKVIGEEARRREEKGQGGE